MYEGRTLTEIINQFKESATDIHIYNNDNRFIAYLNKTDLALENEYYTNVLNKYGNYTITYAYIERYSILRVLIIKRVFVTKKIFTVSNSCGKNTIQCTAKNPTVRDLVNDVTYLYPRVILKDANNNKIDDKYFIYYMDRIIDEIISYDEDTGVIEVALRKIDTRPSNDASHIINNEMPKEST